MLTRKLLSVAFAAMFGVALVGTTGCDEKIAEKKEVDVKKDGTVVTDKETVTEKADGSIEVTKEKDVDKPDRDVVDDDDKEVKVKIDTDKD